MEGIMKTVKQAVCILILCLLVVAAGCSGQAVAGSSGGKVNQENIYKYYWPIWALINDAAYAVVSEMMDDYSDDGKMSGPTSVDFQYLFNKGYIAVIPKNPYTGKDIEQSGEYSPGDMYYEYDIYDGGKFMFHLGEGSYRYSPEMYERGEVEEEWQGRSKDAVEKHLIDSFDGRTETHFLPGVIEFKDKLDDHQVKPDMTKLDEANERMRYMYNQMQSLFHSISEIAEEPGDTLLETVDAIGRLNPLAWINPFTGMPMKEVQIWGPWGYPDSIKAVNPDKEEYAGNYSYVKYEWRGKTWGVLAFYYIQENGELWVYACSTVDQEPYEN